MRGTDITMDIKDMELDPYDYYQKHLRNAICTNGESYFDSLVEKSRTDVEKCRADSRKLQAAVAKNDANEKVLGSWRVFHGLLIFLAIVSALAFGLALFNLITAGAVAWNIATVAVGIVLFVASLLLLILLTSKKIRIHKELDSKYDKEVAGHRAACLRDLYPLKASMDDGDFKRIVEKTTTVFRLDDNLTPEKLDLLVKAYQYDPTIGSQESLLSCQSGNVETNPFLRLRVFRNDIVDQVYTGSLTISWVERVGSGKDATYVTRTQTLSASSTHPAPTYSTYTAVVYGNQAAPDLRFSRCPSGLPKDADEKEVEKFVAKAERKMKEMSEDSVSKGGTFQPLANTTFEALFGAFDRNNEVQYRLLFTPLAQQNMVELMAKPTPFGDDFFFRKVGKMNIVSSRHGPKIPDFSVASLGGETDIDALKKKYVNNVAVVFASLYFELAPILAIPLYQQTEAGTYELSKGRRHVSDYEAECFANQMDGSLFLPDDAATPQILKVSYLQSTGESDVFAVHSGAFRGEPRVDYVSMVGGDGRVHEVPVPWTEYFPVEKVQRILVRPTDLSRSEYSSLLDEKKEFFREKAFYRERLLSKKFFGFPLPDDYNYDEREDRELSAVLTSAMKRSDKNGKRTG